MEKKKKKSSCWHQDPELLHFLLRSYMKNTHTIIWSSASTFWSYEINTLSYARDRLTLLREVPSARYWCKIGVLFLSDPQCFIGSTSSTQTGRRPQPPRRRCWAEWASSRASSLVASPNGSVSVSSAGPSGRCWQSSPRGVAFSHCKARSVSGRSANNNVMHRDRNNPSEQWYGHRIYKRTDS